VSEMRGASRCDDAVLDAGARAARPATERPVAATARSRREAGPATIFIKPEISEIFV